MMFKNFILLIYVAYTAIFATTDDDTAPWRQAELAIPLQDAALIRSANDGLKGKSAPQVFFTSQPKKYDSESDTDFKNRMVMPELLCRVGWEGALFLMSSSTKLQEFFGGPNPNVPLCLKKKK